MSKSAEQEYDERTSEMLILLLIVMAILGGLGYGCVKYIDHRIDEKTQEAK